MRHSTTRSLIAAVAAIALGAPCSAQEPTPPHSGLRPFSSDTEWTRFVTSLPVPEWMRGSGPGCIRGVAEVLYRIEAVHGPGPAVVEGTVTDVSGEPLSGATVEVGNAAALTDAAGRFRLEVAATPTDSLTLVAMRIGYRASVLALALTAGDDVEVSLRLCEEVLALDAMVVSEAEMAANVSITNVQHAGVDEGGIVKLHGDHLVILRRGRLYTVDVRGDRLRPLDSEDAFGPGIDPSAAWYDEMLVSGDEVLVVGYSYERGGTEIGRFHIDDDGGITHRDTHHLRSADYYSSRNFASRLVGRTLVFYAPIHVTWRSDPADVLPALRRWRPEGEQGEFEPIATPARIYRPAGDFRTHGAFTLHTIVTCDLGSVGLGCEATAVAGGYGRVTYTSPTAVYVWIQATGGSSDLDSGGAGEGVGVGATLVRLPLDGGRPASAGVRGMPVDQFSFSETADGALLVLVRAGTRGDGMWGAEFGRGDVALLTVPAAAFSDGWNAPRSAYRRLPAPGDEGTFHNRFVGRHLLYGTGLGWWDEPAQDTSEIFVVEARGAYVTALEVPHGVDRIEAMGGDAVVVGSGSGDLHFTGVRLRGAPRVGQRYVHPDAAQGETRSRGFFYRRDSDDSGVLGLPLRQGPGYRQLWEGSASVVFLRNTGDVFRPLGALEASGIDESQTDDGCVASCFDWYGNARPLFLQGRILALMGSEIVEGTESRGRVRERRRVTLVNR